MGADADIIRRLTEDGYLGGDVTVIDDLVSDDFVDHDPPPGMPGTKQGQREVLKTMVSAFSDRKLDMHEILETTDGRIIENWAMIGTHSGEAFGVPASGQSVRVRGIEIYRCAGGLIVEHWGAVDSTDFYQKAGALQA